MKRREFIEKSFATGVLMSMTPVISLFAQNQPNYKDGFYEVKSLSSQTKKKIARVLQWLKTENWNNYLKTDLGISIDYTGTNLQELTKPLANIEELTKKQGLEDFGGNKLIEPGSPSLSLLYHILASPRVQSPLFTSYPELSIIDNLEDFIYSFVNPKQHTFNADPSNVFLAVLAYEYRPAFKVPPFDDWKRNGQEFAQVVFSRCGVSRTGVLGAHYDPKMRSFTNLPKQEGQEGNVAVMPARYGLFLVELLEAEDHSDKLMNQQRPEKTNLGNRHFINPIKKISSDEDLSIQFGEYHLNEKLKRLAQYSYKEDKIELDGNYDLNQPPFTRISARNDRRQIIEKWHNTDEEMVKLDKVGSSVLLEPIPDDLIRPAQKKGQNISFKIPEKFKKGGHYNRRYGALKMPNEEGHEATNVAISDVFGRRNRRLTAFKATKIAPLFANIKYEVENGEVRHLDGQTLKGDAFEEKIEKGGYHAQLFEDSICDGCISAKVDINTSKSSEYSWMPARVLPAFSLVTAPDFFPFIDSNDIRSAYNREKPKVNMDQDFFEGGTMNLSGIRQRGNPLLRDPFSNEKAFADSWNDDKSFDTLTSVVRTGDRVTTSDVDYDLFYPFNRDYKSTSFLPDTGTGVFFPGWDVTYSGDQTNPYLSTFGLGSPFPEDMKLCAAANGMWPVASPDAGRTFQGALEPILGKRPNTAIPLMDDEIGLHQRSPHVQHHNAAESYGWDGEQGPFLEVANDGIRVNYTDIERADYLQNLLDPSVGFNMALLRDLDSKELIHRMDTQRICVRTIDRKKVWKTKLWMVAAEKIADLANIDRINCLPKHAIFDQLEALKPKSSLLKGEGYIYVFVLTNKNKSNFKGELDSNDPKQKRRLLDCKKIWVCQVNRHVVAVAKITPNQKTEASWKVRRMV